jgi:hypothetical protein
MTTLVNAPTPLSERVRYSDDARAVLAALDSRMAAVEAAVRAAPIAQILLHPGADPGQMRAALSEIMLSIAWYQPHTTEAGFAMLGRLPKNESKLMTSLMHHKIEEAEHGIWARRDYLLLGGSPARLLEPLSPATFAVAAVWGRMAVLESPFAYLGAELLFEKLTMLLAPSLLAAIRGKVPADGLGFITEHATEDIRHTNLITHWILDVVTRYPDEAAAVLRGFDYFSCVYPLAVWDEALERSRTRD